MSDRPGGSPEGPAAVGMLGAEEDAGCEAPASWNDGEEVGGVENGSDGVVADASTYAGQLAVMRQLGAAGAGAARMRSAAAKLAELKHATWVPRGTVARKKKSKAAVVRAEGGGGHSQMCTDDGAGDGDGDGGGGGSSGGGFGGAAVPADRDAAAVALYPRPDPPPLDSEGKALQLPVVPLVTFAKAAQLKPVPPCLPAWNHLRGTPTDYSIPRRCRYE